ncbi:hypothetical protein [Sphingomonas sp.]|nr:hypothetical protein [Sphingomonas sp.]
MTRRRLTLASRIILAGIVLFYLLLAALMIADACGVTTLPEETFAHG